METRCALAALLLLLGGCLSNPTPHPATEDNTETGSTNKQDASPSTDTATNLADDASAEATTTDPQDVVDDATAPSDGDDGDTHIVPDPPVLLRDLIVEDLERDGYDDLILSNWIDDEDQWGITIYRGANGRLGFDYHDRIMKTRPRPEGVARLNLRAVDDPDESYELVVVGRGGEDLDRGFVQVFTVDDGNVSGNYWRDTTEFPLLPDGGEVKSEVPIHVLSFPLPGTTVPRLLIGDYHDAFLLTPAEWHQVGLQTAAVQHVTATDPLDDIRHIVALVAQDADHLALLQDPNELTMLPFATGLSAATSSQQYLEGAHEDAISGELIGDNAPELVTASGGSIAVVRFAGKVATRYIRNDPYELPDGYFDDMAIADIDRSGKPDIILFDYIHESWGKSCNVRAIRDPFFAEPVSPDKNGRITSATTTNDPYDFATTFRPSQIAVGRFNDRGVEIWGFDPSGKAQCIGWDAAHDRLGPCGLP